MIDSLQRASALSKVLLIAVGLLMVVAVGSIVIVRVLRRSRDRVLRPPIAPTPSDDVWSMHRVPLDDTNEENDADGRGNDNNAGDRSA